MPTVGLNLGHEVPAALAEALTAAGFEVVLGDAEIALVTASEMEGFGMSACQAAAQVTAPSQRAKLGAR